MSDEYRIGPPPGFDSSSLSKSPPAEEESEEVRALRRRLRALRASRARLGLPTEDIRHVQVLCAIADLQEQIAAVLQAEAEAARAVAEQVPWYEREIR